MTRAWQQIAALEEQLAQSREAMQQSEQLIEAAGLAGKGVPQEAASADLEVRSDGGGSDFVCFAGQTPDLDAHTQLRAITAHSCRLQITTQKHHMITCSITGGRRTAACHHRTAGSPRGTGLQAAC